MQTLIDIVQAPTSGYVLALFLGAIALSGKLSIAAADGMLMLAFALASIEVLHSRPDWRLGGSIIAALACLCLLIGWWISPQARPTSIAPTPIAKRYYPLPLKMRTLFETDFPQYLNVQSDITLGHADGTHQHVIPMRLYVNFDDQSEFLAFFIPRQTEKDEAFQLSAAAIVNHKAAIESVKKNVQVSGRMPGDTSKTDSQDLTFTGRIYIYYEDDLSLGELAALDQLSKQNGVAPQFRGHDYLVLHWNEQRVMGPNAKP